MDLETQLKSALQRKMPPSDFTSRVMSAIAAEKPAAAAPPRRLWRAAAAAAMLTLLLGGWSAHVIAERRAGVRARDQVLLALHIASAKVRYAQTQVHDIGSKR